jgi:hypothetical protein
MGRCRQFGNDGCGRDGLKGPMSEILFSGAQYCAIIERELVVGTFDYWEHFPRSRSAKAEAMFPRRGRVDNVTVECWMRRWLDQVKPRWGAAMVYDVESMIDRHIVPQIGAQLLRELSIEDVGRLTGTLRQRPGVRGQFMGPSG